MSKHFSAYGFDPLIGTEIMTLLGIDPAKLDIPSVYRQFNAIVSHFAERPNRRYEILKLLSKPGDKLDNVWSYVELKNEKLEKLKVFDPKDFEADVASDIVAGHITQDNKKKVYSDIRKQKAIAKKEQELQKKADKTVSKALDTSKLDVYESTLKDIDQLDRQLNFYG